MKDFLTSFKPFVSKNGDGLLIGFFNYPSLLNGWFFGYDKIEFFVIERRR